ncbi:MAG TPA: pilus assembly protein TadG-related protein [Thermomicrobiales bacterium]
MSGPASPSAGGGARPAQIVVMFALFATALVGALGLATDLGISFAGRRAMQNAADAAAYAGARKVAKAATASGVSASSEVGTVAGTNGFAFASATPTVACAYVTDADASVGDCSATVPAAATGVKVTVTETHPTFFLRVVPGGPETATTRATATAHVEVPGLTGAGPFIVCATDTILYPNTNTSMNVLNKVGGSWQLNTAAVGKTFLIHGPQINKCANSNNSFKGIADTDANKSLTAPPEKYFGYSTGTVASISATVDGIQGCQAGGPLDNCVAYLPMSVVDAGHPVINSGSNKQMWTIGFASFLITQVSSNTHTGKLLGNYIVKHSGGLGWTPTYFGPVVIKLTK